MKYKPTSTTSTTPTLSQVSGKSIQPTHKSPNFQTSHTTQTSTLPAQFLPTSTRSVFSSQKPRPNPSTCTKRKFDMPPFPSYGFTPQFPTPLPPETQPTPPRAKSISPKPCSRRLACLGTLQPLGTFKQRAQLCFKKVNQRIHTKLFYFPYHIKYNIMLMFLTTSQL